MLHKQVIVITGITIATAVVSSALTWRMMYPRAVLAAKAELIAQSHSESLEVGRVVAELRIIMPASHKKTRPQDIARIMRNNIAQMYELLAEQVSAWTLGRELGSVGTFRAWLSSILH